MSDNKLTKAIFQFLASPGWWWIKGVSFLFPNVTVGAGFTTDGAPDEAPDEAYCLFCGEIYTVEDSHRGLFILSQDGPHGLCFDCGELAVGMMTEVNAKHYEEIRKAESK